MRTRVFLPFFGVLCLSVKLQKWGYKLLRWIEDRGTSWSCSFWLARQMIGRRNCSTILAFWMDACNRRVHLAEAEPKCTGALSCGWELAMDALEKSKFLGPHLRSPVSKNDKCHGDDHGLVALFDPSFMTWGSLWSIDFNLANYCICIWYISPFQDGSNSNHVENAVFECFWYFSPIEKSDRSDRKGWTDGYGSQFGTPTIGWWILN